MNKFHRILVVDGSRLVRATLRKHLKDNFEIVEEGNGESAWQTLMLDASIAAVITGIHPPKLEAYDLQARLKASSIRRLREMPFALIVSDVDDPVERSLDRSHGINVFISKSMKKSSIVDCVGHLVGPENPGFPDALPELLKKGKGEVLADPKAILGIEPFRAALTNYPMPESTTDSVCVLAFTIDGLDGLSGTFGESVAEMIAARFASLLVAKVGKLDSIGHCSRDRLAILSHGVDLKQGVKFGKRVCKSLASGQITIRGQQVRLTVSVGVASTSDDEVRSAVQLLALAENRLEQALVCGGNTVAMETRPECPLHAAYSGNIGQIDLQSAHAASDLSRNVGLLGLRILPLMRIIDRELQLGLPLAEIKRQLEVRARSEESAGHSTGGAPRCSAGLI